MINRPVLLTILSVLSLSFQHSDRAPEIDSIRKEEMRPDLFFLAGDDISVTSRQGSLPWPFNSLRKKRSAAH
jgi:hypothetical protein